MVFIDFDIHMLSVLLTCKADIDIDWSRKTKQTLDISNDHYSDKFTSFS
jgi:hypothetical protein